MEGVFAICIGFTGVGLCAAFVYACLSSCPVSAQEKTSKKAVVEFYTSQGCKACAAADRNLAILADQPDVLALSFHVNYWDYLGWRDTLAIPDSTERQNGYKTAFALRAIYTPQAIVNGSQQFNGNDLAEIDTAITASSLKIPVTIHEQERGRLTVEIGAGNKTLPPAHIKLFYLNAETTVAISGGENAGQTATYRNAVRDIDTIGLWDGKAITIEIPVSSLREKHASGVAIVLQQEPDDKALSPILGAALYNQ